MNMDNDRYYLELKKRTQFDKRYKRNQRSFRSMVRASDTFVKLAKEYLEENYKETPLTLEEQVYKDLGWSKEWIAKMTKKSYMLEKQRDLLKDLRKTFNIDKNITQNMNYKNSWLYKQKRERLMKVKEIGEKDIHKVHPADAADIYTQGEFFNL